MRQAAPLGRLEWLRESGGGRQGEASRRIGMITEVLRKASHFRNLSEEEIGRLAEGFEEIEVGADAAVYEAGQPVDGLFVVARGTVVVFRGARGEESWPVARLCSGDLLGTADLFDSERYSETACALEDSVVMRCDRSRVLRFLEDQPEVVLNLRLAAARDLTTRAKVALEVAHRQSVRHRVNRKVRVQPSNEGALRPTLIDLSAFGMSLRGVPDGWQPGAIVDYRLEWGNRRLDMTARVVWREDDTAGIDLQHPSRELQAEIGQMLEAMLRSQI